MALVPHRRWHRTIAARGAPVPKQHNAVRGFSLFAQEQSRRQIGSHHHVGGEIELIQVQIPDGLEQPASRERNRLVEPLLRAARGITVQRPAS
ncbi:MAG: hypothetical protein IPM88_14920 [Nitrospira sp.]|nr:hypothetical protein [Nitrospira sp.]